MFCDIFGLTNKQKRALKDVRVGGMSFEDGIVMRTENKIGVAIIDSKNKIRTFSSRLRTVKEEFSFLGWPFIRGIVLFFELFTIRKNIDHISALVKKGTVQKESFFVRANKWYVGLIVLVLADAGIALLNQTIFSILPTLPALIIAGIADFIIIMITSFILIVIFVGWQHVEHIIGFHGAEHKTIAAYEKTKKISIGQADQMSRLHPRCGTNYAWFLIITIYFIFAALPFHFGLLNIPLFVFYMLLSISVSFELFMLAVFLYPKLLGRILLGPAFLFQTITTREPSKKQLEVAAAALKTALE